MEDWAALETKELERQLSPIRWSPSKNKQAVLDSHVEAANLETRLARKEIPCQLNIPYGTRECEQVDVYGTDLPSNAPVFIWIHGGFWLTGSKDWSGFCIRNNYSWGLKSVIVGYPLGTDVNLSEISTAIHNAVKKSLSLFPEAYYIIAGHSAGAHLVCNAILFGNSLAERLEPDPNLLDRIVGLGFYSGVYDIRPVQRTAINEALQLTPLEARELSPLLNQGKIRNGWLKKKVPLKVLVAVGAYDPPEFLRQSQELVRILLEQGFRDSSYWKSDEDDHFTIIENFANGSSSSSRKLREFLLTAINANKRSGL